MVIDRGNNIAGVEILKKRKFSTEFRVNHPRSKVSSSNFTLGKKP